LPRIARIASRRPGPAALRERRAAYRAALPGPAYWDASALLKLYVPEAGSDELNDLVVGRGDLLVSDLAATEVVSALARRLRGGLLTREQAQRLQRAIVQGLDDGVFPRVELTRAVHRHAEHFLLGLAATPLRAADSLHLALALSMRAASMASFDESWRWRRALSVWPSIQRETRSSASRRGPSTKCVAWARDRPALTSRRSGGGSASSPGGQAS
jgi:predicted nucleic acid-binding protein